MDGGAGREVGAEDDGGCGGGGGGVDEGCNGACKKRHSPRLLNQAPQNPHPGLCVRPPAPAVQIPPIATPAPRPDCLFNLLPPAQLLHVSGVREEGFHVGETVADVGQSIAVFVGDENEPALAVGGGEGGGGGAPEGLRG